MPSATACGLVEDGQDATAKAGYTENLTRPRRPAKARSPTLQRAMGTHGERHGRSSPMRSRTMALAMVDHRPCADEPWHSPWSTIALAVTNHGTCHGRPSPLPSRVIALAMTTHGPCDGR